MVRSNPALSVLCFVISHSSYPTILLSPHCSVSATLMLANSCASSTMITILLHAVVLTIPGDAGVNPCSIAACSLWSSVSMASILSGADPDNIHIISCWSVIGKVMQCSDTYMVMQYSLSVTIPDWCFMAAITISAYFTPLTRPIFTIGPLLSH